jgi:hypothetical protein
VSNVFKNPTWITNESLRLLKNNLQFVKNCSSENLSAFSETPKKGETINVRKPSRFSGRTGETYSAEDYNERVFPVTVQATEGVDLNFSNRELMFNQERFSERVLAPAMQTLANKIDRNCINLAVTAVANAVGTPGTIPTALKTYAQARAKMSWEGAPQDEQNALLVTPDMQVEITDAIKGLFHSSTQVEQAYAKGMMGVHAGAKWYECQNLYTHTVGALGGTPLTNGAGTDAASNPSATTSNVVTDGWTAAAATRLKKNDVITFAGCYAVNPWTRQSTGALRQFVVQADAASDASGNLTVTVSPAIFASGPFQNVTNVPADNSAITVLGAANTVSPVGLRFHRDAFLFTSFDQPTPTGAVEIAKMASDPSTGVKIRLIKDWDTKGNASITRLDVVYAFGTAYGELACRVQS